jgi:hypothetical protein
MTFADAVGYGESMGMRVDVVTGRSGSRLEDRNRKDQSWCFIRVFAEFLVHVEAA